MSAKDPVCGMDVEEDEAIGGVEYEGEVYYFCARSCMEKFKENPTAYVKKAEG